MASKNRKIGKDEDSDFTVGDNGHVDDSSTLEDDGDVNCAEFDEIDWLG
jgi:hypothetical protein